MEQEPQAENEQVPTREEIIEAARDYLTDEDIAELTDDPDEVYNDVVTILEDQGVDWQTLFEEKGILQ